MFVATLLTDGREIQENITARFCSLPDATTRPGDSAVTCAPRPPAVAQDGG